MVISESKGNIKAISVNNGRMNFSVICPVYDGDYYEEVENDFAFNRNNPTKVTFEELFNKKVKVTVEIIDD